ncbi:MAG: endonuclease III [Coriobacteriia bacterium]|nr:endonuclease III [Coriobacteriia bacterium]
MTKTKTQKESSARAPFDPTVDLDAYVDEIMRRFKKEMPGPVRPALDFVDPYQCVCAVSLSAQTTDVSVNKVTPVLFARYPDVTTLASADPAEVEQIIHSLGFFRNKTKNLIGMARKVIAEYGGEIPHTMEELITLPGVARKTANIVLGSSFGIVEGIAVDTHVFRIAHRLGLSNAKNPDQTERDLCAAFPREHWYRVNYEMVNFGRTICDAKKPQCAQCFLNDICPYFLGQE